MATMTKVYDFVRAISHKEHDLSVGGDQYRVAFTNLPHNTSWDNLSDLTEVSYNFASDASRNLTTTSSEQSSGTFNQTWADLTITGAGGTTGPFRYAYIYNVDNAGGLVGFYDLGSPISVLDTQDFVIDFTDNNNVAFTLS